MLNTPINPSPRQQSYITESITLDVRKSSLDDRRSGLVDLDLELSWTRPSHPALIHKTNVAVPQFSVLGSQPRVLASVTRASPSATPLTVNYTFENPSNYLLKFDLSAEPSGDQICVFEGDEVQEGGVLWILPLTRRVVRLKVESRIRNGWIRPKLKVLDREFGKILRVGLTKGCRSDEKGDLRVWIGPQGEPKG